MKYRLTHLFALLAFVVQGVAAASTPISSHAGDVMRHCAESMVQGDSGQVADQYSRNAAGACCDDTCPSTTDCVATCAMTAFAPTATVEFFVDVDSSSAFDFAAQCVDEITYPPLYSPPIA